MTDMTSYLARFPIVLLASACFSGRDAPATRAAADSVVAANQPVNAVAETGDSATATAGTGIAGLALQTDPDPIIRALYVNRFASQSSKKMTKLIAIADSTEINALVIDVKDEFGLNFRSADPMVAKNQGTSTMVPDMKQLLDTLRAHGILPIARIVVFKDSVAARLNPSFTIKRADGSPWRDRPGLTWVNPYANSIWEYNFRVAEEAVRLGFGEIQFDYIRFPEPYRSLPQQVFPESRGRTKSAALAEFLTEARRRLSKLGVRTTADIFGLVSTVNGALEVGQQWEPLAKAVDVVLPMTYPSHYPRGSFGVDRPNANPYRIQHIAISKARQRNEAIGVKGERVRPWIQAFTLGKPIYGAKEIEEQKRGIYDAGYDGWVLWHPGSNYDPFVPAFEKTLVSRKKNPPVPVGKYAAD